jgi:hypothetical protein
VVKHAPPQQLLLREIPKDSVYLSSGFAIYDEDVIGWRMLYKLCHVVLRYIRFGAVWTNQAITRVNFCNHQNSPLSPTVDSGQEWVESGQKGVD